jgi:alkanesulfonate monooxygenase SsuD/methylene tetrahydromethanopterin reductase-like flavin-dependent oxidoreductase (luciferase family)
MTRPFRFGVVAPVLTDLPTWRDRVRRIADSGYSTLLMPDVPQWQPAPAPTLAIAAALTDLRVGTWVYASPLRPAWSTAWEAHSMSLLTEGRFEMGIGTGRPGIEDELRELGMPVAPPRERLAQVRETVATLRDLDGPDVHTPVVMAFAGRTPKRWPSKSPTRLRSQRFRAILAPTLAVWQGTSVPCGTSSSRSTSQSSATTSPRS